jgi:hypothetical protein
MNEKVISGLKSVRRMFYMWATACAIAAVCDIIFLERIAAKPFFTLVLVFVILGGAISSFIEGYEKG